ncbi:YczE/YyaS/YitT family protein [[Pasteurella] aerogenes]
MKLKITTRDVLRFLFFFVGICVSALGIVLVTKADLGTSQISSVPYVLSLAFDWLTFGQATFVMNLIFLIMQMVLLKNPLKMSLILQIPVSILFSYFIDLQMQMFSSLTLDTLAMQWVVLLLGCVILGLGISLEIAPNIVAVPGDAVVNVIATVKRLRFGKVKVILDVTLVAIALVLSFFYFGDIKGIGAGTLVSALLVGRIVMFFNRRLRNVYLTYLVGENVAVQEDKLSI